MRLWSSELDAASAIPDLSMNAIFHHAMAARAALERVWDDQTAFHGVLPLGPEEPDSRGQCGVSSVWLARYLSGIGFQAMVAEGVVVLGNDREEDFVWVRARGSDGEYDADITSDQFRTLFGSKVHVGQADRGAAGDPVIYRAEILHDSYDVPRRKLMARYNYLENRVNDLSWWHRRHLVRPLPGE
jgi:hypothetical protein